MITLDTHDLGKVLFLKRTSEKKNVISSREVLHWFLFELDFYDGDHVQFELTYIDKVVLSGSGK